MADPNTPQSGAALERVAKLMTEALDLLDAYGGPAEAAAHLDLALQSVLEATASHDRDS